MKGGRGLGGYNYTGTPVIFPSSTSSVARPGPTFVREDLDQMLDPHHFVSVRSRCPVEGPGRGRKWSVPPYLLVISVSDKNLCLELLIRKVGDWVLFGFGPSQGSYRGQKSRWSLSTASVSECEGVVSLYSF